MTDEWYVILNMNCKYEICRGCPKSGLFKGSLKECDDWVKQKQKDEIKDKISFALKDPILQQGFEIICKEKAELEKENIGLKTKITALENANRAMLKELDNMTSGGIDVLKIVIRNKEKLNKAKELLRKFLDAKSIEETCVAESEAEQFLRNLER